MNCKICASNSAPFGKAKLLNKYLVSYFRCDSCGFIQTETPYWIEEAYSEAITRSDIGLISRNLEMAEYTKKLILTCLDPAGKFVDYGGGYGIFTRLMRDQGFDFYRFDPLCRNLFSEGYDADPLDHFTLLTAFEVFEHLQDPLADIEKMLSLSQDFYFTTRLLPGLPEPLENWWYYGLEHGQHISFYTPAALGAIAQKFALKILFSNGVLHLMGKSSINPILIKITFSSRLKWLRKIVQKRTPASLLASDYKSLTGKPLP